MMLYQELWTLHTCCSKQQQNVLYVPSAEAPATSHTSSQLLFPNPGSQAVRQVRAETKLGLVHQELTLPEPWLTTARVEGLDASLVALTALTRDGGAWQIVVSLAVAEVWASESASSGGWFSVRLQF